MLEGKPVTEKTCADSPAARNLALFQKLGFQGTPGIVFKNGAVVKGFVEAPKLPKEDARQEVVPHEPNHKRHKRHADSNCL